MAEPITTVDGRAYPWGAKNIDTDVIIPAHWLKTTTREGLGKGAFESVRAEPGNLFDDPRYAGAPILIAGENFGCGSSREHAAWALGDMGVKAVIAPMESQVREHQLQLRRRLESIKRIYKATDTLEDRIEELEAMEKSIQAQIADLKILRQHMKNALNFEADATQVKVA